MSTPNLYEEFLIFALLLLGVVGVYILLKLHYIFAFGLVEKTSISDIKKEKIQKIQKYVFIVLKVLLVLALLAMFLFGSALLIEGMSLKQFVLNSWAKIPEGFWTFLLFTLFRIAVLIVVSRYILKIIYTFLDKQQHKLIEKKVYKKRHIETVYERLHNTIKYTVVLGIVYRITHFFPFLEIVSDVLLLVLILFFTISLFLLGLEVKKMFQQRDI